MQVERLSTGLLSMDWVLGGGLPLGRIIEVWGMPRFGKTSLVLEWVHQFQQQGHPVLFADLEHALDPSLATLHGVDLSQVVFPTASADGEYMWGEDLLMSLVTLGKVWHHGLFVIDSVPALLSRRMAQAKDPDNLLGGSPATLASLLSQGLRIIAGSGVLAKNHNTLVLINQVRNTVNNAYVSRVRPGGEALPFYSSVSLEVRRGNTFEDEDSLGNKEQVGHEVVVRVEKNKNGPAYRSVAVPLWYRLGFDTAMDALLLALRLRVVERKGSWYVWADHFKEQGQEGFIRRLRESPAEWELFYSMVQSQLHQVLQEEGNSS